MSELKYLTQSISGGNPIYITDIVKIADQLRLLATQICKKNSFDSAEQSVIPDIRILSGFESMDDDKVSTGYIYFKGDIYGFEDDTAELTLGGYLVAKKTTDSLRTSSDGVQYYAYNVCLLSVEATQPSDTSTVIGEFTADNIAMWKQSSLSSENIVIPNGAIGSSQIAAGAIGSAQLSDGAVIGEKVANGAIGLSNLTMGTTEKMGYTVIDPNTETEVSTYFPNFGDNIMFYSISAISPQGRSIILPDPVSDSGKPAYGGVIRIALLSQRSTSIITAKIGMYYDASQVHLFDISNYGGNCVYEFRLALTNNPSQQAFWTATKSDLEYPASVS